MKRRTIRSLTLLIVLGIAAACGQKADVSDDTVAAAPEEYAPVDSGPADPDAAAGDPAATGSDPAAVGSGSGDPAVGGATASGAPTPAPTTRATSGGRTRSGRSSARAGEPASPAPTRNRSGAPAPAPAPAPGPGGGKAPAPDPGQAPAPARSGPVDRTGVTDSTIRIGIHAPITGAAPFPQNAFDKGKDVYWKWLAEQGGVHGRNVEVVFRDDQFNPSRAVQVCREMVEQEKVFMLFGAAGSEQITACARYADAAGVPYFSGGVNEDGLTGLNSYFAVSQTYSQQSPVLASLIKNKIGKSKVAIVLNDTPALNEAQQSITAAVQQAGLEIVRNSRIGKNASDSELLTEANALRTSGAEVVYILTSPVNFIKLATNAQAQAYSPVYVGPGVTNGLNIVAEAGCPAIGAAKFLSPFPQLDVIDRLDRNYRTAYAKHAGGEPDDIGIAEWGLSKVAHKVLEAAGRDLSRESLMAALVSGKEFVSNVYPVVSYTGRVRFGAQSSHLLEADCGARRFRTAATFANGF